MRTVRDLFIEAVNEIIEQELDETQQEQFAIEGKEIVDSLFESNGLPDYVEKNELIFDIGFSQEALEIQAASITFLEVINSCFSLLGVNYETGTKTAGIDDWKRVLEKEETNPYLIEL